MKIFLHGKNFKYFLECLILPIFFWRQTVDTGPNPKYEEKVRVPPPPPHHHTHSPWVTVYDEKLLARWSVIVDWVISGDFIEDTSC